MIRRLAAAVLALVAVLVWASPAHAAGTPFFDNFEAKPTNWTLETTGLSSANMIYDRPALAHSGSAYASLGAHNANQFAAVGRLIHLTPGGIFCQFTVSINPLTTDLSGHNHMNIEVINPSNWTYVAVGHADFTSTGWQVGGIAWIRSIADVYIRVSELGDNNGPMDARVDDASVTC
jgi:hypothetical protein